MTVRVSTVDQEILVKRDAGVRVTQTYSTAVTQGNNAASPLQVTQNYSTPVFKAQNHLYATQIFATVLYRRTPDFRWLDMFVNEEFPHDISYNSIGATLYETEVTRVDSGYDQRNSRWDQPLMEYDVAYGVRTTEQLHDLIQFFRAMRGRAYSFRYFDRFDYNSVFQVKEEGRGIPAHSAFDQNIGTGDNSTYRFQLRKKYSTKYGVASTWRPIYKPKPGTVLVAMNGAPVTNWTCDFDTGIITFTYFATVQTTLSISLQSAPNNRWRITGAAGTFSNPNFAVGRKIVSQNWVNPQNNSVVNNTLPIFAVAPDFSYIDVNSPSGMGTAESNRPNAIIHVHPAPPTGATITAGYEFWVPVRFNTDRLPVSFEEYGIGGAGDVRLIEVRREAE